MASSNKQVRELTARIGGYSRWRGVTDRTAATAVARKAAWTRFEREVDPGGVLDPETRAKLAETARNEFYTRIALKAVQARRARSAQRKQKAADK